MSKDLRKFKIRDGVEVEVGHWEKAKKKRNEQLSEAFRKHDELLKRKEQNPNA